MYWRNRRQNHGMSVPMSMGYAHFVCVMSQGLSEYHVTSWLSQHKRKAVTWSEPRVNFLRHLCLTTRLHGKSDQAVLLTCSAQIPNLYLVRTDILLWNNKTVIIEAIFVLNLSYVSEMSFCFRERILLKKNYLAAFERQKCNKRNKIKQ
jgi:hypothetical protein